MTDIDTHIFIKLSEFLWRRREERWLPVAVLFLRDTGHEDVHLSSPALFQAVRTRNVQAHATTNRDGDAEKDQK